ncbi:MAG TPA: DUF885 domain-containing protein [Burkholderiaceae bacterium]
MKKIQLMLSVALAFAPAMLPATSAYAAPAPQAKANSATAQFHALLDEHWQWSLREFPESATALGDRRYNDRFTDVSPQAALKRKQMHAQFAAKLKKIDASKLSGQDRISYAVFAYNSKNDVQMDTLFGKLPFGADDAWLPMSTMGGVHTRLSSLPQVTPFASVADYEMYLKRLAAVPQLLDQTIARLQAGMDSGWMPAAIAVQRVPGQLDTHLQADLDKNLLYAPLRKFPADVPEAEQARLREAGRKVVLDTVIPAFAKLKAFYQDKYLPRARKELGATTLPGGPAYYQAAITAMTTTEMTAKQIHEIGLAEVARIDAEMAATIAEAGFKGTRAEFATFINTDPQFLFTRPEDMLTAYRDIAKRADAALPALFAELPRLPYGIRAMEAWEGDNAEHYTPGSADGTRPAYFEANVLNLKRRSIPSMVALALHEAVPGHHLQIARAQELGALPNFRRYGFFGAYTEGWALYAESLGYQMGLYTTPYSRFGRLTQEMHRAVRLVVDTGIHAFGWERDRAIDYLESKAAISRAASIAEIDRYINWPGQALGYKLGELRIKALRDKAKAALGDKFDIRRFHNAVLDNGSLPLDVLEQQIDVWIAAQKAKRT